MKKIFYFIAILTFTQSYCQQKFNLKFHNAYGIQINFSIDISNEHINIELFENSIKYIEYIQSTNDLYKHHLDLEFRNYGKVDSIDKNIALAINDILKFKSHITIPLSKYPDIVSHLNNIYEKSICNENCDNNQCGVDVFTLINGKTDSYREHRKEVFEDYKYFFQLIKNEFKNQIIENKLNLLLEYFDIHYLILNTDPLIVELYDNYYGFNEEKLISYDFPKNDKIYLILKGEAHLSSENISFLKNNYASVYFLIDDNFFNLNDPLTREDRFDDVKRQLQKLENNFSNKLTKIKFDFSNKETYYNSFSNYLDKGSYLSKEIDFRENYDNKKLYIFKNYIFGFHVGLILSNENTIREIQIWDNIDYDIGKNSFNDNEYPDFKSRNGVYKIDPNNISKFDLNLKQNKNKITGEFSGILYNQKINDSILIKNGKFIIDLSEVENLLSIYQE